VVGVGSGAPGSSVVGVMTVTGVAGAGAGAACAACDGRANDRVSASPVTHHAAWRPRGRGGARARAGRAAMAPQALRTVSSRARRSTAPPTRGATGAVSSTGGISVSWMSETLCSVTPSSRPFSPARTSSTEAFLPTCWRDRTCSWYGAAVVRTPARPSRPRATRASTAMRATTKPRETTSRRRRPATDTLGISALRTWWRGAAPLGASALRPLPAAHDLGDPHAELVVDDHDFAARDERAVDEQVDGAVGRAVELDHVADGQAKQVAHAEAGAAEHGGHRHLHVAEQVERRRVHLPERARPDVTVTEDRLERQFGHGSGQDQQAGGASGD